MEFPNWFAHYAQQYFEAQLARFKGRDGLRFLQLGVFTGDASEWLLDNILTGVGCVLVDVDTWEGSDEPEHEPFDWAEVEARYDARMAPHRAAGRLVKNRCTSDAYFALNSRGSGFDFVYVDGDHSAATVLRDGRHAVTWLRSGGLIAFDDYLWKSGKGPRFDPGPGVDTFAEEFAGRLTPLASGLQMWFEVSG